MKKVLILGSQGTLGTQLVKLYPEGIGWDRDDIDVTDFPALRAKVSGIGYTPDAVINCVAFNDVDGAEECSELAFSLNADFPGKIAGFTKELGIPLVHYSTNYVFDGVRGEYAEADAPSPLSVYGRSKLQGEQLVAENGGQWYIVRTAVLFGPKGDSRVSKKSFVDIMLDLSSKRDVIQAVSDEINSLTYACDLAQQTRGLLASSPVPGIYHIVNSGGASWFDFAKEIFRIAGKGTTVLPVASTHFSRKASRPQKAVLLNTKLPPIRPWTEALAAFLSGAD